MPPNAAIAATMADADNVKAKANRATVSSTDRLSTRCPTIATIKIGIESRAARRLQSANLDWRRSERILIAQPIIRRLWKGSVRATFYSYDWHSIMARPDDRAPRQMTNQDRKPMFKNPIDGPFRSREEIELEQALADQYRKLGNAELLATMSIHQNEDRAAA